MAKGNRPGGSGGGSANATNNENAALKAKFNSTLGKSSTKIQAVIDEANAGSKINVIFGNGAFTYIKQDNGDWRYINTNLNDGLIEKDVIRTSKQVAQMIRDLYMFNNVTATFR